MISVVIPTYNRRALIGRAIQSALAQGDFASEIIVVDDGSQDDTEEVCASYGRRVIYLRQENAGASAARNAGVRSARQPWVAFLDSDDYWTQGHLERIAAAINATRGQATFYFSDMQWGESRNPETLWGRHGFNPRQPFQLIKDGTNWSFLRRQPMMLQSAVFSRDTWLEAGGLDRQFQLVHDTDAFFKLSIARKICAVTGIGCIQTDDDLSAVRLTTSIHCKTIKYWSESAGMWQKILKTYPALPNPYRKLARRNLASARWRLMRLHWTGGNHRRSLLELPRIFVTAPSLLFSLMLYRRSDRFTTVVIPQYD